MYMIYCKIIILLIKKLFLKMLL